MNRSLSRLYRKRRAKETGLLIRLGALPRGMAKAISAVRDALDAADTAALVLCGDEGLFRFVKKNADPLGALRPSLEKMQKTIDALIGKINPIINTVDKEDPTVWEVKAILRRFESAAVICSAFLEFGLDKQEDASEVFWLERSGGNDPWAAFNVTPVSIAPSLKEALFEASKTVVCVSATLSAGGFENDVEKTAALFHFWAERTGAIFADRKLLCGIFPSPFPYDTQTLLAVPSDAPLPDSLQYQAFTSHAITELVRLTGGSALVLFTSYQALRNAFEECSPVLEKEGITCLKQGDDDRTRLLQRFLEEKTSVLFGTDSFWEGVDAPGETLRLLILCRLPFKTLKDPVFEARREYLENSGRNSFVELSLPDAVMKFKQGFGRLMRNSSDYGAIVVLDGRLLHKLYGKTFLGSLPETKTSFKEFDGILLDMERFFYS